jgi:hypothetical protein
MTKNSSPDQDAAISRDEAKALLGTLVAEAPMPRWHGFDTYEVVFRAHFEEHHAAANGAYTDYRPVYRYGYELGTDGRYRHADWVSVEQVARPPWEVRNPDTWAQFQDTIRFAWETARVAR